jgi:FHA domain-containing protein
MKIASLLPLGAAAVNPKAVPSVVAGWPSMMGCGPIGKQSPAFRPIAPGRTRYEYALMKAKAWLISNPRPVDYGNYASFCTLGMYILNIRRSPQTNFKDWVRDGPLKLMIGAAFEEVSNRFVLFLQTSGFGTSMQIRIDVVAIKGAAALQPLGALFDVSGGTIGRVDSNKLVLADSDRTVSRVHAQIVYRDDHFVIVDRGSNALQWNGQLLGAGNEAKLASGDKLFIGSFELSVAVLAAQPQANTRLNPQASDQIPDDPFADLLDGLPHTTPVAAAGPTATSKPQSAAALSNAFDPFDDLLDPMPQMQPKPAYSPNNLSLGKLDAADDFSDLGLGPGSEGKSLDALFGLDDVKPHSDPFAFSASADPLMQPNTTGDADPLKSLGVVHKASASPVSDHIPALQHAYVPPPTRTEFVPVDPNTTISRMPQPKREKPLERLHNPMNAASSNVNGSVVSQVEVSSDELLAALLRGLQMTHQAPQTLTPELMERMGSILRTSAEGTIQLLLTRQEFKRELRADVTMIASTQNNPLKFSPTPEVALAHLLGEQVRGFMAPRDAMRDAFNDLKAHQLGVMVGMKAALTQLLERFTPEALEEKIAAKSKLDVLFTANRKAKLWDQFCTLQKGITREAEDDFHNLFGKEFANTYDEQMALMKQAGAKSGS